MRWILAGLIWGCAAVSSVSAAPASSADLIGQAKVLDGALVVYEGEAIGEKLDRDAFVWVSLYDGSSAVSIWMPKPQARTLSVMGGYKQRGDEVRVVGVFHRACPEHGGVLDIHAERVRVVRPGRAVLETMFRSKVELLISLLGVLVCLVSLSLLRRKRAGK